MTHKRLHLTPATHDFLPRHTTFSRDTRNTPRTLHFLNNKHIGLDTNMQVHITVTSVKPRKALIIVIIFFSFDMDMSYARMVRTASLTSFPVRCKILHQRTASLSVTNDVTRPLVCARITCYVTVITV
jgi:hypothetical protein